MTTLRTAFLEEFACRWAGTPDDEKVMQRWKRLESLLGAATDPDTLEQGEVDAAFAAMRADGLSAATRNRHASVLGPVLRRAGRTLSVPRSKEDGARRRWLTRADVEALKAAWPATDYGPEMVDVLHETGLRLGELYALQRRDVTGSDDGLGRIHVRRQKAGGQRSVPATAAAWAALARLPDDGAGGFDLLPRLQFQREFRAAREAVPSLAGDPEVVPHALRHACASRLVAAGVALPVVQRWMGHRSISTTMRYVHVRDEQLADAAVRLDARREA